MIKRYNQYIKEEFDIRNLFSKNKYYKSIDSDEIDSYGEEDWDEQPSVLSIARENPNYKKIITLRCYDRGLTSLEGIEQLTDLKYLYCYNNQLTNLNGIENLNNLKGVFCWGNLFSKEYKDYLFDYFYKKNISFEL